MHTITSPNTQAIVMYYLAIPVQLPPALNAFRQQHDPKYMVNEAHATLIAPFGAKLMTDALSAHIAHVAAMYPAQEIVAQGYHITAHGYVFYTFDAPSAALLSDIYNNLTAYDIFQPHADQSHPFLPHITIGKFEDKDAVPNDALNTLQTACTKHSFLFDRMRLYGIIQEPRKRARVHDYLLQP